MYTVPDRLFGPGILRESFETCQELLSSSIAMMREVNDALKRVS